VHLTDHVVRMISNMKLGKEKSFGSYRCFLVVIPSRFQPKSNTAHIQKKSANTLQHTYPRHRTMFSLHISTLCLCLVGIRHLLSSQHPSCPPLCFLFCCSATHAQPISRCQIDTNLAQALVATGHTNHR
jgi:hypothetical protein